MKSRPTRKRVKPIGAGGTWGSEEMCGSPGSFWNKSEWRGARSGLRRWTRPARASALAGRDRMSAGARSKVRAGPVNLSAAICKVDWWHAAQLTASPYRLSYRVSSRVSLCVFVPPVLARRFPTFFCQLEAATAVSRVDWSQSLTRFPGCTELQSACLIPLLLVWVLATTDRIGLCESTANARAFLGLPRFSPIWFRLVYSLIHFWPLFAMWTGQILRFWGGNSLFWFFTQFQPDFTESLSCANWIRYWISYVLIEIVPPNHILELEENGLDGNQ